MSTIYPDCYDEWGLYEDQSSVGGDRYKLLYEGTREECVEVAREYEEEERREGPENYDRFPIFLMDWEGGEWDV